MVSQDPALTELAGSSGLTRNVSQLNKITRVAAGTGALDAHGVGARPPSRRWRGWCAIWRASRGKEILLETEGEDTELDRNMVEVIADPLVHMVRNAADHGIETPEEREARASRARGGSCCAPPTKAARC